MNGGRPDMIDSKGHAPEATAELVGELLEHPWPLLQVGDDPDWTPFRQFKEYRQLALRNEDYTN